MKYKKIKCNNINYRKGYIEVQPNIHEGFINIEAWDVHVDVDIANLELMDEEFPEDGIISNSEIEMSLSEAEVLVEYLRRAIAEVKKNKY